MISQCKDLGFKVPVWNQKDNTVQVTFPDVKVPFNYNEGITATLKDSLTEIAILIAKENAIKASEIALKLNKSYKTIERQISTLREIGAIEHEGSKKAGGYTLTKKLLELFGSKK